MRFKKGFEDICIIENTEFVEISPASRMSRDQHIFRLKINLINFAV